MFDVIKERRQRLTGSDGKVHVDDRRPAFLDLLLSATDENGKPLGDDALEEETATFMFEGHGAFAQPRSHLEPRAPPPSSRAHAR